MSISQRQIDEVVIPIITATLNGIVGHLLEAGHPEAALLVSRKHATVSTQLRAELAELAKL